MKDNSIVLWIVPNFHFDDKNNSIFALPFFCSRERAKYDRLSTTCVFPMACVQVFKYNCFTPKFRGQLKKQKEFEQKKGDDQVHLQS